MNVLLRKLNESGLGYTHASGETIAVTAFCDDLCLLSDDPHQLQSLLNVVGEFATWSRMEVAPEKTEITGLTLTLDWKYEKEAVCNKVLKAIELLEGSAYTYNQLDAVVRACVVPLFRYSAAITPWTQAELINM
eukprot:176547-Rhodomonas_salina.1